jgi:hypothetical protein
MQHAFVPTFAARVHLRQVTVTQPVNKFPTYFIEPEVSSSCSQKHANQCRSIAHA